MTVVEHVLDLIPAYALGSLDQAEVQQVTEHLEICASCRAELHDYQEVVDNLPLGVLPADPPSHLKERILQQARQTGSSHLLGVTTAAVTADAQPATTPGSKPGWWQALKERLSFNTPALGLVSLALVLLLGATNLFLWQRLNQVEGQYQQVTDQYLNTLRTVPLTGTEFTPNATGLLVISKDGEHGTVVVDRLPVLDEAHEYQLWLIRDGERTSGGVFSVDENGYGAKWIHADEPLISFPSFGVTIEPAGGSPGPTGDKVLGGDL